MKTSFAHLPEESQAMQKIIETGNSAAVTIPAAFMKALSLRIGDQVEAAPDASRGHIIYTFPGARQLRLANQTLGNKRK